MNYFLLGFLFATINSHNVSDFRKHYGLSYSQCGCPYRVIRCMAACKSIGYQIYRLDVHCKCKCHEMKTSTILPFFKWRTNGTTFKLPKLHSPRLYEVIGTLSPQPTTSGTPGSTQSECPTLPTTEKVTDSSVTKSDAGETTNVMDGVTNGTLDNTNSTGSDSNSTSNADTKTNATAL